MKILTQLWAFFHILLLKNLLKRYSPIFTFKKSLTLSRLKEKISIAVFPEFLQSAPPSLISSTAGAAATAAAAAAAAANVVHHVAAEAGGPWMSEGMFDVLQSHNGVK